MHTLKILGALAVAAAIGATAVISVYPQPADAQTQGMNRRGERRDTRQDSRTAKHECKASGNNRSDCRQEKRQTKQQGRHD